MLDNQDSLLLQIASSLDLESTLQSITDAAAGLAGADTASIYLSDDDGQFRARASHGVALTELQSVVLRPTDGLLGRICTTGLPFQVAHFSQEVTTVAEAYDMVAATGIQATLAIPLMRAGECIGALYVARREAAPFPPEDIQMLARLAAFAEVAVENARRFSDVEAERIRLQAYMDAVPEGIIVFDRDGMVIMINQTMERDLGVSRAVVGRHHDDLLQAPGRFLSRPIHFRYDLAVVFTRVLGSRKAEQGLVELDDPPRTFEIHYTPIGAVDGSQMGGVVATLRDITEPLELERERSHARLLTELLNLSAVLNSDLSVPVLVERVVEVAMTLIGARSGTLGLVEDGKLVFRRFHKPDGWIDFDVLLERGQGGPGHVWETAQPYVSNDCANDPIVMSSVQEELGFRRMVCVPVVNRAGTMAGTLSVYDPIVERDFTQPDVEILQLLAHQVAIAIENARLNELKDAFLSIVSHELKTPVTSIKGFAQVLQRKLSGESKETGGRYLEIINQQTDRLTALINDLLDLSRIQTGRFRFEVESLDYAELVRDVVAEMELITPNNPLVLDAPAAVTIRGNGNRLRQVLVNLINNAARHGPAGTPIRVTVDVQEQRVRTCVQDEGQGLPTGEEERIFSPYYQVQRGPGHMTRGLGLGLYISRQVVEEHGGRIWVESSERTTFCFEL